MSNQNEVLGLLEDIADEFAGKEQILLSMERIEEMIKISRNDGPGEIICRLHADINALHEQWDEGTISTDAAIELIKNMTKYLISEFIKT